ncbi:hypothetical protein VTK73DRAFT_25 [Phialemonium thermophilum]|uniref:Dicer-like protein 2 n=1 Tax=Phialemonium thermophilum TaxID=223376 RepID=A0ABR3Y7Q0_9PEZI
MLCHDIDSTSSDSDEGEDLPLLDEDTHPKTPVSDIQYGFISDSHISPDISQCKDGRLGAMEIRAYQQEMLEKSMERNIIVAMDTGSGKTEIAILRIQKELERSRKLVWFLASKVVLACQQFDKIKERIPSAQCKLLCGSDDVKTWSNQRTWDAVLQNIQVVVSTYQILFDAVKHSFVRLSALSLIVFDEAHNCRGLDPGGRIMIEYYWPSKTGGQDVPHILGLTASPAGSGIEDLETLERTLDAVCRSPTRHRDELLTRVNHPVMRVISYRTVKSSSLSDGFTPNMRSLSRMCQDLDISRDPIILHLQTENTERAREQLEKAIMKNSTFALIQLRRIFKRSVVLCQELGPWAADYYLDEVISRILTRRDSGGFAGDELRAREMRYLAGVLEELPRQPPTSDIDTLSNKVKELLRVLLSFQGEPVGIVFVEQRVTTAVLSYFLSRHREIRSRYRVGAMVGTSVVSGRREDFTDLGSANHIESLEKFRNGKVNLLIATSVLEEGIDVPSCNLVVCFDKPDGLRNFIQRRGRARMRVSELVLLVDDQSQAVAQEWHILEQDMKRRYEDEMRRLDHIRALEDSDDTDYPVYNVPVTGTCLTIDDAKSHLEHFCRTITARKYVDSSPYYIIKHVREVENLVQATVQLPVSLPPELRKVEGIRPWRSEKNACKDAAFQAYVQLHRAGLINDHLLPFHGVDSLREPEVRPGKTTVKEQLDPWPSVAQAWRCSGARQYRRRLMFANGVGTDAAEFELVLPVSIPDLPQLVLYWDPDTYWTVEMADELEPGLGSTDADDTGTLLSMAFGHRWPVEQRDHIVRFVARGVSLSIGDIGRDEFRLSHFEDSKETRLVRDPENESHPHFFESLLSTKPPLELVRRPYRGFEDAPEVGSYVVVKNWPKKAGYFRQPVRQQHKPSGKPYHRVLPATRAKVDGAPAIYAYFGMFIPSILHALEVHLVASELMNVQLEALQLTNLPLIATAICTPAARMPTDYERIEFLGDAILKLCVTGHCLAKHPDWPERFLSLMKDQFVANSTLSKAACMFGLDRFIITKPLTLRGWRPMYVDDVEGSSSITRTRELSTKTLADVVEALIGVSYLEGSLPKALSCISLFLPQERWETIETTRTVLYEAAPADMPLPVTMEPLEMLLGYTFRKKSLLVEAMTHSSYNVPGTIACLERLEFLGDAILDYVVVSRLLNLPSEQIPVAQSQMHLLRTALVNGDFTGFLTMFWSVTLARNDVVPDGANEGSREDRDEHPVIIKPTSVELPLWSFLRFSSTDMAAAQKVTRLRYLELRDSIAEEMQRGKFYPWALLARLRPQKFYADVFESILGAVWADSGSFDEVEAVLERAGVLPYMRRLLNDEVHILHPKEELSRLAGPLEVKYLDEVEELEDGTRRVASKVTIGDRVVASVVECLNREEAWIRVAERAIEYYRSQGGHWKDEAKDV